MFKHANNQLKICDKHYNVIWQSEVHTNKTNNWEQGGYAILQDDGNFVVYDGRNRTVWSTGTSGGNKTSSFGTGITHAGRLQYFDTVFIIENNKRGIFYRLIIFCIYDLNFY